MAAPSCLIPRFDGAILSLEWKEALWDKFVPAAPRPRTLNNLAFDMQPDARRNQEWQLPDPTIGYRKMDGFAALPCMLIEAKLGYAGYLIERFV
ncbi:MAG: hypothetical protein Q4G26_13485, partial [Paracoccus sp. (in: a-proteobacteria)]|nr:hypothetical protein [Paracoccus sp. (in: a-proteobacteria)]